MKLELTEDPNIIKLNTETLTIIDMFHDWSEQEIQLYCVLCPNLSGQWRIIRSHYSQSAPIEPSRQIKSSLPPIQFEGLFTHSTIIFDKFPDLQ